MSIERDRFLTEAMGLCWHEKGTYVQGWGMTCGKCGKKSGNGNQRYPNSNFSTWEGFGLLWEWGIKQEWWDEFMKYDEYMTYHPSHYTTNLIHKMYINPDKFADAVYEFLKENS